MGGRSRHRMVAGTVWLAAVCVVAGAGACAQGSGELGAVGTGDADAVEPEELVPLLIVEEDGIPATSYGEVPMTSDEPDEYYQPPPDEVCGDSSDVELVGPSDMYSYLGDGGDYLYIEQWVSGEATGAAAERFDAGVEVLEGCGGWVEEVDVPGADVDDIRRYERTGAGEEEDRYFGIVYARHGGVTMLLFVDVLSGSDFDEADVEHLVDVALDNMTQLGRVEVAG